MSDVVAFPPKNGQEEKVPPVDACDVVDAVDDARARPSNVENNDDDEDADDADFQDFTGGAQPLEGETVAEARRAAATAAATPQVGPGRCST